MSGYSVSTKPAVCREVARYGQTTPVRTHLMTRPSSKAATTKATRCQGGLTGGRMGKASSKDVVHQEHIVFDIGGDLFANVVVLLKIGSSLKRLKICPVARCA